MAALRHAASKVRGPALGDARRLLPRLINGDQQPSLYLHFCSSPAPGASDPTSNAKKCVGNNNTVPVSLEMQVKEKRKELSQLLHQMEIHGKRCSQVTNELLCLLKQLRDKTPSSDSSHESDDEAREKATKQFMIGATIFGAVLLIAEYKYLHG